jgi:Protein of unknown function (DUF2997)
MPEKKIQITIHEDGKISAKTDGFKGETCLEALEALLGAETQLTRLDTTDEYNQHVNQQQSQQLKNRKP